MSQVLSFIPAILLFGLIIFIHELGHFIFARKNGIFVIEFALGMGPKLISKKIGETVYSLRLLPIGGFCQMLGEDDDVDDERAFSRKGPWARFMVVFGGPFFNFVLALIVAVIIMLMVEGYSTNYVADVSEGMPAAEVGLEVGDKIVEVNDKYILASRELSIYIGERNGDPIDLLVKKGDTGEKELVTMTPYFNEEYGIYQIGITRGYEEKSFLGVIKYSFIEVVSWIKISFYGLERLVGGNISPKEVSGPVGIVNEVSKSYRDTVSEGFYVVFLNMSYLLMILSVNIGVMNLLPIPALDGGRLVFIIIELIRKKPVNKEREGLVHTVGFALLMLLVVLVMYNDIMKIIR